MADKELNELSKETLRSYLKKSSEDKKKKRFPAPKVWAQERLNGKYYHKTNTGTKWSNYKAESIELEEKSPLSTYQRLKTAYKNTTKDLPGGPVTKAATLAGIDGVAAAGGYAAWGLPGAAIAGGYGLYQGYKALKGEYNRLKEDLDNEAEILASMILLYELRSMYEDIKNNLKDEDFQLFFDEGFEPEEIVDLFATQAEEWEPLLEAYEQLDELSKKTLGNYLVSKELRRRYDDKYYYRSQEERKKSEAAIDQARNAAYGDLSSEQKDSMWAASRAVSDARHAAEKKFERRAKNSYHGTVNAVNRLQGKFAAKTIIDEPEVRSPKRGFITKHARTHTEYKDYKAESVELEECDDMLSDRSRKIYMNPKMVNVPLEGKINVGGSKGNSKIKKQMKEDTEINEISKKVLGSYISKSLNGVRNANQAIGRRDKGSPWEEPKNLGLSDQEAKYHIKNKREARNRETGIRRASDRLQGHFSKIMAPKTYKEDVDYKAELESIVRASLEGDASDTKERFEALLHDRISDIVDARKEDLSSNLFTKVEEPKQTNESVMVNEISKKTLGSYIKKASSSRVKLQKKYDEIDKDHDAINHATGTTYNVRDENARKSVYAMRDALSKDYRKQTDDISRKDDNRYLGITRAVKRLTKEDNEDKD